VPFHRRPVEHRSLTDRRWQEQGDRVGGPGGQLGPGPGQEREPDRQVGESCIAEDSGVEAEVVSDDGPGGTGGAQFRCDRELMYVESEQVGHDGTPGNRIAVGRGWGRAIYVHANTMGLFSGSQAGSHRVPD
jgi:hypothetical protein